MIKFDDKGLQCFIVEDLNDFSPIIFSDYWFRGHSRNEYLLKPSLFREDVNYKYSGEIEEKHVLNDRMIISEYKKYLNNVDSSITFLQAMYRAQHYGLKTRLLDFTSDFYVALYFAIDGLSLSSNDDVNDLKSDNDNYFSIFCLNPETINEYSQLKSVIFETGDIKEEIIYSLVTPVAISPIFDDKRLFAQKGKFLIFGQIDWNVEYYNILREKCLKKILIPKYLHLECKNILKKLNYSYQRLFPEDNFPNDEKELIKTLNIKQRSTVASLSELAQ